MNLEKECWDKCRGCGTDLHMGNRYQDIESIEYCFLCGLTDFLALQGTINENKYEPTNTQVMAFVSRCLNEVTLTLSKIIAGHR